mmetsp:Transcript_97221/g.135053  ORF Transcript_97221/g.135053 Transcript_97221/m.135053 type:complete len:81 (+) Transcript_97221:106-348(+)
MPDPLRSKAILRKMGKNNFEQSLLIKAFALSKTHHTRAQASNPCGSELLNRSSAANTSESIVAGPSPFLKRGLGTASKGF